MKYVKAFAFLYSLCFLALLVAGAVVGDVALGERMHETASSMVVFAVIATAVAFLWFYA